MSAPLFRLENRSRDTLVGDRLGRAHRPWSRAVGLLGRRSLSPGQGLVLVPCNSIHMLFMRFPVDVLYVDKRDQVVKVVRNLKPFRVSACLRGAHYTVELPVGTIDASGTDVGDRLALAPAGEKVSV